MLLALWSAVRSSKATAPDDEDFCGVHKDYLAGYIAVYEHRVNLKTILPTFIASSVLWHYLWT